MLFAGTVLALGFSLGQPAAAQSIDVKQPWIRGTVQGQKATGAYLEITSKVPARLVAAESPVANVVELHNMKMEGGVMKMFAVDAVDLPASQTVKLAPGGYHVMLMELKQALKPGERIPLRLTIELAADRTRQTVDVTAEVRALSGTAKPGH
jgi:copper(I)-binding protein